MIERAYSESLRLVMFLFALTCLSCDTIQADPIPFQFAPPLNCSTQRLQPDLCQAIRPKAFSESERLLLQRYLNELQSDARLSSLFRKVRLNRNNVLRRATTGSAPNLETGRHEPSPTSAWVSPKYKGIQIADRFFAPYGPDPVDGFETSKAILLHELVHAALSPTEVDSFATETGWEFKGVWDYTPLSKDSKHELRRLTAGFITALNQGRYSNAYHFNRTLAQPLGLPSAYSLDSPGECVAEVVSILTLGAERSAQAIPKAMRDWVHAHVYSN